MHQWNGCTQAQPSDSAWQLSSHCWALLVDVSFVKVLSGKLYKPQQPKETPQNITKLGKILSKA